MTLSVADLTVDLSKHRVSTAVLDDLTALATRSVSLTASPR